MKQTILLIMVLALVGCKSAKYTADHPFVNILGMKFVSVPGTKVEFCIWETRVKDYAAYAAADAGVNTRWQNPSHEELRGKFKQAETHPVVMVGYDDAKAFCAWLTKKELAAGKLKSGQHYRLPTDAEWSVAVGLSEENGDTPKEKDGGVKDVYPWGEGFPPPKGTGNYRHDHKVDDFHYTSPVGSFAANKLGLHDMGGNVLEWCEDWYDPAIKKNRVLRGASWWNFSANGLMSASRWLIKVDGRVNIGFRCVLADD